jgi:hypothetical protein
MITIRSIWIYIFAFLSLSNLCTGDQIFNSHQEIIEEKLYISIDQVILTKDGMFLMTEKGISLITQLNWDDNGYYLGKVEYKKCYNGHPQVCLDCHGCGNKTCVWRCNCYDGLRQN